jgi:hypothetical protein
MQKNSDQNNENELLSLKLGDMGNHRSYEHVPDLRGSVATHLVVVPPLRFSYIKRNLRCMYTAK